MQKRAISEDLYNGVKVIKGYGKCLKLLMGFMGLWGLKLMEMRE